MSTDLDGNPRVTDGDADGQSVIDMGPYEAPTHYRAAVSITGNGEVTSDPPGIDCGDTCSALFGIGSVVNLSAAPDANSLFLRWDGDPDCSDGEVTLDQPITCIAVFDSLSDAIFVDDFESGTSSAWSAVIQ